MINQSRLVSRSCRTWQHTQPKLALASCKTLASVASGRPQGLRPSAAEQLAPRSRPVRTNNKRGAAPPRRRRTPPRPHDAHAVPCAPSSGVTVGEHGPPRQSRAAAAPRAARGARLVPAQDGGAAAGQPVGMQARAPASAARYAISAPSTRSAGAGGSDGSADASGPSNVPHAKRGKQNPTRRASGAWAGAGAPSVNVTRPPRAAARPGSAHARSRPTTVRAALVPHDPQPQRHRARARRVARPGIRCRRRQLVDKDLDATAEVQ